MDFYIYIGAYILGIIGISYFTSKNASNEDFLISGRDRSSLFILASKFAGAVGVSTFITYTGYAYRFGPIGVLALMLGIIVGYSIFAYWAAPRANRLSQEGQFYTQGDLVSNQTKNAFAGKITNYITTGIQFFWILLSLVGGAKIIEQFGILNYEPALVLTSAVVLIYVLISGYKAVIITDLVQAFVILGFLVLVIFGTEFNTESPLLDVTPPEKMKVGSIIGLLLYGALSVYGLADRYQLCYSAKSEKAARNGMAQAILPMLIVAGLLFYIGLIALNSSSTLDADMAFIHVMTEYLPKNIYPILLVLFFAGLMSSADTNIFAVASHLNTGKNPDEKVKQTRIITLVVVIVATTIAFYWKDIIDITIIGAAMRLTLSVPMIHVLRSKVSASRYIGSIIGGLITFIIGILLFGANPKLALIILLGTLLGLLYKKREEPEA